MRADEAQAAVARCLVNPRYFDCAAAPGMPVALYDDLRLFRGFISRIKHTQLRRVVPLTLRLLAVYRLDIAFFAHVAPSYFAARAEGPLMLEHLFERFERELLSWVPEVPEHERNQVEEMLRHEARVWRVGRAAPHGEPSQHPRLLAGVAVERFMLDVLALAEAMTRERFTAPVAKAGDHFVLYRKLDESVRIEAIDPLSAWLFSRLDGSTSVGALAVELSSAVGADAQAAVCDLLADAADRRLLDYVGT